MKTKLTTTKAGARVLHILLQDTDHEFERVGNSHEFIVANKHAPTCVGELGLYKISCSTAPVKEG